LESDSDESFFAQKHLNFYNLWEISGLKLDSREILNAEIGDKDVKIVSNLHQIKLDLTVLLMDIMCNSFTGSRSGH